MRLSLVMILLSVLAAGGCSKEKPTVPDGEWQVLDGYVVTLKSLAEDGAQARSAALKEAVARPLPASLGAPCPIEIPKHNYERTPGKLPGNNEFVLPGDVATGEGPVIPGIRETLRLNEATVTERRNLDKTHMQSLRRKLRPPVFDTTIVVDEEVDPVIDEGHKTFRPGRLKGRLFVYSYADEKVICAAPVEVTNDAAVLAKGHKAGIGDLRSNLRVAAHKAGMAALGKLP